MSLESYHKSGGEEKSSEIIRGRNDLSDFKQCLGESSLGGSKEKGYNSSYK